MAEEVKTQEAPTGEVAVAEAPKEQPSEEKKYTADEMREKIASGELKKEIGDADPHQWMETHLRVEAAPEPPKEEPKPEEKETPKPEAEEKPKEEKKETKPRKTKEPTETVDWFVKQLQERGFNYDTPEKALEGYVNKENAVVTYRNDAKQLRQKEAEAKQALERERQTRKDLESRLKALEEKASQPAEPMPAPEIPELPEISNFDGDEGALKNAMAKRDAAIIEANRQMVERVKREYDQKFQRAESTVQQLTREFNQIQQANKKNEALQQAQRAKENAFMSANELMKKVDDYKLSKPIDKVYDDYSNLLEEVNYLTQSNPAYKNRDLVAEYLTGNRPVVDEFNRRGLEISDDMRKYMIMAQLENDCYLGTDANGRLMPNPVLFKDGRPNLVAALRIREEGDGVIQRRVAEAEMKGYDKAQEITQHIASAPKTMEPNEGGEKSSDVSMSAEQALEKLRQIRQLPPSQIGPAMAELRPHLEKIPELQVT